MICEKYKKIKDLLNTNNLVVYLVQNNYGQQYLIQKLNTNKINDDIKKEKSIKIIKIMQKGDESYIIIKFKPEVLTNPLIGPIYPPFSKEEDQIISSKLNYAYCSIVNEKNIIRKETIGYFVKFKIKNFPIKKGLFINYINTEKVNNINFKYDNKMQSINLSTERKIYSSFKYDYTLIEIMDNDNIKDFLLYDENINCNFKNRKNFLLKEVVCLSFNNKKYYKNSIINVDRKDIKLYDHYKDSDIINFNYNLSVINDKSLVILLNEKENDFPIIDNYLINNNNIEDIKKQIQFSLIPHPLSVNFANIKIEENCKYSQTFKDGRISMIFLKDNLISLKIYNKDFILEDEIIFEKDLKDKIYGPSFKKYKILNNGDILIIYEKALIIRLNKSNPKKYDIIRQLYFNSSNNDVCEYKDYLIFCETEETLNIYIWKYDSITKNYISPPQELHYPYYNEEQNHYNKCQILQIAQNKIILSEGYVTYFFEIINDVFTLNCIINEGFYFCPFTYKGKYLLSEYGNNIFDLNLRKTIAWCLLEISNNCYCKKIIKIPNGNLLIEYEDHYYEKKYLIEATIFQNEIYVIQKTEINYDYKLITCLNNGKIILVNNKKKDDY